MADVLKKVQPGDKLIIPASTFNTFVDVADDWKRSRLDGGRGDPRHPHQSSGIVLVRNDSGADRARFGVLGIDAPVVTPTTNAAEFAGRPVLSCVSPTADHAGRFVILQEPLPSGSVGFARVAGCSLVMVHVTDEDHEAAEIEDGEAGHLASAPTGSAAILWKETGTGEKWALVRLGPQRFDYVVFNQEFQTYTFPTYNTWVSIPLHSLNTKSGGSPEKTGEIPAFEGEVIALTFTLVFYDAPSGPVEVQLINHTTGVTGLPVTINMPSRNWEKGQVRVAAGAGLPFKPWDIIGVQMKQGISVGSPPYLQPQITVSMTAIRTGDGTANVGTLTGTPAAGSTITFPSYNHDLTFRLTNTHYGAPVQIATPVSLTFSGADAAQFYVVIGREGDIIVAGSYRDFYVGCHAQDPATHVHGTYVADVTVHSNATNDPLVFHLSAVVD